MALLLEEMTGEELLLAKTIWPAERWQQIDSELDRRAIVGPPARRVAPKGSSRFVRPRSAPTQRVA